MTAKSRRRKRYKGDIQVMGLYRFLTNKKVVLIKAPNLNAARTLFQEKYGYWPEQEIIDE